MSERPNVLIIYPDQMRADVMGCAGNPLVRTPNLDRLAAGGVRFENAFTSYPLCCPFRGSVMTGKYAHAHGMMANHHELPLGQTFLAEVFAEAGYRTGYVGKWHLDTGGKIVHVPPERRLGFQWFVGFNRGHEYMDPVFYRQDDPRPRASRRYEPDVQTDHLIEFMQEASGEACQKPFLAMVAYGPPHPPLVATPEYLDMHAPGDVPVRANTPDDPDAQARAREFLSKYYGLTVNIDRNVGRVLDWLDEAGIADNTIVVLVSDHGDMAGEHGRFGKSVHNDASMRVPLIVRWPKGLAGGRTATQIVDPAVDIMPTLLALCGIDVPDCVQGVSFAPALADGDAPVREAVWYQLIGEADGPERVEVPLRGVRTLDWLYVRTEEGPIALHDLRSDPLEMDNLVASADHADVAARLDAMLANHMREVGDDWSARATFPPPGFVSHEEGRRAYVETLKGAILEE